QKTAFQTDLSAFADQRIKEFPASIAIVLRFENFGVAGVDPVSIGQVIKRACVRNKFIFIAVINDAAPVKTCALPGCHTPTNNKLELIGNRKSRGRVITMLLSEIGRASCRERV